MAPSTPTRSANRVAIALILLATSFQVLATGGLGLFLPLIRDDLGLTFTQAGALASITTLVYALMQIPSGALADRYGARRLFAIGVIGVNALGIALASVGTWIVAMGVQAIAGLVRAFAFTPGLVLMSEQFAANRRATAMGLFVAGGFAWTVLFGIVAPAAAAATDWRVVFTVFGAMGIAFGLAFVAGTRSTPPDARASRHPAVPAAALVRRPALWVVGLVQFARLAVVQGVAIWLPTYLGDERGLPLATVGAVVAVTALATAPSNLVGGLVADRSGRPYAVIGVSLVVLAAALATLAADAGPLVLGAAILAIAAFQQLYFGPLFASAVELLGAGSAGLVSGIGNFFANIGAVVAVFAMGAIKDATGTLAGGFAGLAVLCVVALAGTWWLQRAARIAVPITLPPAGPPSVGGHRSD